MEYFIPIFIPFAYKKYAKLCQYMPHKWNLSSASKLKKSPKIRDLWGIKDYDKNTIHLPRQDSWTTRNPRNNGAKWGIIRYLLSWKTTGRLPFFFFKSKNVKVIVNRVYIVWTPLKVIVNSVLPGDYSGCELKIVLLYYMDRFPCTGHVETVVLMTRVNTNK